MREGKRNGKKERGKEGKIGTEIYRGRERIKERERENGEKEGQRYTEDEREKGTEINRRRTK